MSLKKTEIAKKNAAKDAAELIQEGMIIGLGSGSTALFFIEHLIERCRNGLKISAVATSQESYKKALEGGIPMRDINELTFLDIAVDGADEIDQNHQMIKGGGGALLREKIVANMSNEMLVIVDESKLKEFLGQFPLPVEILPFAHKVTIHLLKEIGHIGHLRLTKEKKPYITDNGNFIYDINLHFPCKDPESVDQQIRRIPGVIETGLFIDLAGRVIVGYADGKVNVLKNKSQT